MGDLYEISRIFVKLLSCERCQVFVLFCRVHVVKLQFRILIFIFSHYCYYTTVGRFAFSFNQNMLASPKTRKTCNVYMLCIYSLIMNPTFHCIKDSSYVLTFDLSSYITVDNKYYTFPSISTCIFKSTYISHGL